MQIDKETNARIKKTIKTLVERKVKLTRERREYKLKTRGKVDEGKRLSFFWNIDGDRSALKHEIRHGLLLYAFIRGMDYKRLEPKVRDGNKPSASDICLFANEHDVSLKKDDVLSWLGGDKSPFEWKRREDAEEAA